MTMLVCAAVAFAHRQSWFWPLASSVWLTAGFATATLLVGAKGEVRRYIYGPGPGVLLI